MTMLLEHPIEWLTLDVNPIIDYNIEITRHVATIPNHVLESSCGEQFLAYIKEHTDKIKYKVKVVEWIQGRG